MSLLRLFVLKKDELNRWSIIDQEIYKGRNKVLIDVLVGSHPRYLAPSADWPVANKWDFTEVALHFIWSMKRNKSIRKTHCTLKDLLRVPWVDALEDLNATPSPDIMWQEALDKIASYGSPDNVMCLMYID